MNEILSKLEYERVVSFELYDDKTKCHVMECCDCCFGVALDKSQLTQMIYELSALRDTMD